MLGKIEMRIFMLGRTKMRILMLGKIELRIFMLGKTEMRILMHRKNKMVILMLVNTKLSFFMLGKTDLWRWEGCCSCEPIQKLWLSLRFFMKRTKRESTLRVMGGCCAGHHRKIRSTKLPLWFHALRSSNFTVHLRQGLV